MHKSLEVKQCLVKANVRVRPFAILVGTLHVEYAERRKEYGILSIFSLFCEYFQLEYVRIHAIYRVYEAEYGIHILVVAPHEYV